MPSNKKNNQGFRLTRLLDAQFFSSKPVMGNFRLSRAHWNTLAAQDVSGVFENHDKSRKLSICALLCRLWICEKWILTMMLILLVVTFPKAISYTCLHFTIIIMLSNTAGDNVDITVYCFGSKRDIKTNKCLLISRLMQKSLEKCHDPRT